MLHAGVRPKAASDSSVLRPPDAEQRHRLPFPFSGNSPRGSQGRNPSITSRVEAPTQTSPAGATPQMRAARFTLSPMAVYSKRPIEPTFPTSASPVLIPKPKPLAASTGSVSSNRSSSSAEAIAA